jgi:hypothetical protein
MARTPMAHSPRFAVVKCRGLGTQFLLPVQQHLVAAEPDPFSMSIEHASRPRVIAESHHSLLSGISLCSIQPSPTSA